MNHLVPWTNYLIGSPINTVLVFLIIDFGILFIWNMIYIKKGTRNTKLPGPRGHLSFYMCAVFDLIFLPILGFTTVIFLQTAIKNGHSMLVFNPTLELLTLISAIILTLIFPFILNSKKYGRDWSYVTGPKEWKIWNLGQRGAGWWHSFCQIFFFQFFAFYLIVSSQIYVLDRSQASLYFINLALMSLAIPIIILDNLIHNHPQKWPNIIISKKLFGKELNI